MIIQPARFQAYPLLRTIEDKWMLCLVIFCLALTAAAWPESLGHLRYDRLALANGEVWRVASAHLVHLNLYHLLVNLFGLVLICELQWGAMPLRHGFGLAGFSGVAIGMALWWLHPELQWYAGLSGALHGLWSGCALYGLTSASLFRKFSVAASIDLIRSRFICVAGLMLLAAKLLLEYLYGPSPGTEHLIGASVVTEAHRYGALAGGVYVLFWRAGNFIPGNSYSCR